MTNLLNLVENANNSNSRSVVNYPIKRTVTPLVSEMDNFRKTLTRLAVPFTVADGTVTVLLENKEQLNRFAQYYFPALFKAQLTLATQKDRKMKRNFREIITRVHPNPHTFTTQAAIVEVTDRLNRCGLKI